MPCSNLFAVSNQGRVFALQTDEARWEELPYLGIDFKRVSAHDTVVWALGGDHQVYVFVYGTSVPIRVCEESYENQRWNPLEGFTNNLLPSDRPLFSSVDGLQERSLQDIHLPSLAWNWEGPWHLQDTFDGKALDKECWTYAVDFPRAFSAEKSWKSCVRRRKWVRYRRYIALDTWSAVDSIHKDHTEEPFIDIAVGGGDVMGEDPDRLMVWGITAFGKVAVRQGICATCPEGNKWTFVPTPPSRDVICLSVGRSGRVWSLSWDGAALVRTGVTRDCPLGVNWVVVDPPGSPLKQISAGNSVVWGVCRDSSVWFRRGLDEGGPSNWKTAHDTSDLGVAWLPMVGSLNMVSVGPNNQVWGITSDDSTLVVRTGVTPAETTGKTWKAIRLPLRRFDPDLVETGDDDPFDPSSSPSSDSASRRGSIITKESGLGSLAQESASLLTAEDSESQDAVSMRTEVLTAESDGSPSVGVSSSVPSSIDDAKDDGECEVKGGPDSPFSKDRSPPIAIDGPGPPVWGSGSDFASVRIRYPEEVPDSMTSEISETVANFIGSYLPGEEPPAPLCLRGLLPPSAEEPEETGDESEKTGNGLVKTGDESETGDGVGKPGFEQKTSDEPKPGDEPKTGYEPNPPGGNESTPPTVEINKPNTPSPPRVNGVTHLQNSNFSPLRPLRRGSLASSVSSLSSESFVPGQGGEVPREFLHSLGGPLGNLPPEDVWMWVSGSGCWFQPANMPKWFLSDLSSLGRQHEPWRGDIAHSLQVRKEREIDAFKEFTEAVECSSWVVSTQCRYLAGCQWVPATLELHMTGSRTCRVQEAFLKIVYTLGSRRTAVLPCCSIVLSSLVVDLPAKALVSLYTPTQPLKPIPLLFSAEKDAEQWLNHISSACTQFRGVDGPPSIKAVWAVSSLGFIYFHDFDPSERELTVETRAAQYIMDVGSGTTPLTFPFERGFRPGCFVTVKGKVHDNAKRFNLNLTVEKTGTDIALHFNPRFNERSVILNWKEHNEWGQEQREPLKPLARGKECNITLLCDDRNIKISSNDRLLFCFDHRIMPWSISHLYIEGDITITGVTYNHGAGSRTPREYFWRGVGGHLRVVEAGAGGVTWGLSYDGHVYTYTGVCGGGIYKGNGSEPKVHVMSDIRHFHVWENQRWNPVTGFTHRGLPTDRKTWSDESGRHERTKEGTKLPSRHWQWVGEWTVDHHTPAGVDKDGWQYATDFPMSYHGHRYVTDLVRRRRWVRKCRVATSGPWRQMEKVALISLSVAPNFTDGGTVPVWGVSASNEVVIREGVTPKTPRGNRWALIPSETPMKEICAGIEGGVWAVSCSGQAHLRIGVTKTNPKGYDWVNVDAPHVPLQQVGMGKWKVWALDREGSLYYRINVQPLFPEGTAWERVCSGVESITVAADGSLGAVLHSYPAEDGTPPAGDLKGVLAMRKGITPETPTGTGWDIFAGTGWSHLSARIPVEL